MLAMLALASVAVYRREGIAGVRRGAVISITMTRSVLPMVVLGIDSGIVGILIGTAVGAVVPAGPYVVLHLLGGLLASGAGAGPVAAFITAWSVIPVSRTLIFDVPFLGPAFTFSRLLVALPFPFVAGFLTPVVFRLID